MQSLSVTIIQIIFTKTLLVQLSGNAPDKYDKIFVFIFSQ